MKVAIHQPHYFPWIGYFDKMAKVDAFVLLDEVQLETRSQMLRNRIIGINGDTKYITIKSDKAGYTEKKYSEILTVDNVSWKKENYSLLREYYRKAPYYKEILEKLEAFFQNDFSTVCEWTIESIRMVQDLLNIPTKLVYQSDITYDRTFKKSDMDLGICISLGAETYFSGRGASVDYLNREKFSQNGVNIVFQDFTHPVYPQIHSTDFVSGISILDMFFNCGIEETRRIFWENVHSTHEFDEIEE